MKPSDQSEGTVFDAARHLAEPAERAAYLDGACAGRPELRERVERLLRAERRADEFLGSHPAGLAGTDTSLPPPAPVLEQPGDQIGRYKLLEKLGEGGFGVVYMAEQREPVRRKVALKIIKVGMDTKEVVARFEAERQALALMDHPHIAKVLDGGATGGFAESQISGLKSPRSEISNLRSEIQNGRPYFVMELVRGIRITDFCDQNHLGVEERLALFMQVCQAVQHAHQKGIIHRDLKPSNILVTINDGVPVPKVIDFGIAKATQQELTEKTLFTAYGQFLGTPAYMSPEQTVLTSLDIDTRSDIYSLGVLLYELLTGQPPFDTRQLLKIGLDELCRTLREVEPPRPSTRLSTMAGEALASIAKFRKTDAPRLVHHVRGDLDWIVMKCLEKDRARRYESANGLAADIQRHLTNEPVAARPPSAAYRFQKLVRRKKLAVAAAAAVILALIIGAAVSTWQAVRATRAEREQSRLRQAAQTEATRSRQVADLLRDMLEGVHPEKARGRDTTILRDVLRRANRRIDTDLKEQPLVAAELRSTLGRVYIALADLTNGVAMHRQALALRQQVHGAAPHVDIVHALLGLGHALVEARQYDEAERTLRDALAMSTAVLGRDGAVTARVLNSLGFALLRQLRYAEAEPLVREAVTLLKQHLGQQHADVGGAEISFGEVLTRQHRYPEAQTVLTEAVAILKQAHGEDNPTVCDALSALGHALSDGGKPDAAEPIGQEALRLYRKLYGNDHPNVAGALLDLADVLVALGRAAEAEPLCREALAVYQKCFGAEHSLIARAWHELGRTLSHQGRPAEAEPCFREALAMKEKLLGHAHPDVIVALNSLGAFCSTQGRHVQAEQYFRDALAVSLQLFGREHKDVSDAYQNLGLALWNRDRPAEAEAAFEQCLAIRRPQPGYEHPGTGTALRYLALARMQQGRAGEAEAPLREALELHRKFEGDEHRHTVNAFDLLFRCLERQGNWADMIPLQRRQLERLRRQRPPDHPETLSALAGLGRSLTEWAWTERPSETQNMKSEVPERAREAERLLRECLTVREAVTNLSRGVLGDTQSRLGGAVLAVAVTGTAGGGEGQLARFAEAERLLLSGHALMQRSTAAAPGLKRAGLERLERLYSTWEALAPNTGQGTQVAEWRQKLADFDRTNANTKPAGAEP